MTENDEIAVTAKNMRIRKLDLPVFMMSSTELSNKSDMIADHVALPSHTVVEEKNAKNEQADLPPVILPILSKDGSEMLYSNDSLMSKSRNSRYAFYIMILLMVVVLLIAVYLTHIYNNKSKFLIIAVIWVTVLICFVFLMSWYQRVLPSQAFRVVKSHIQ